MIFVGKGTVASTRSCLCASHCRLNVSVYAVLLLEGFVTLMLVVVCGFRALVLTLTSRARSASTELSRKDAYELNPSETPWILTAFFFDVGTVG